MNTFWKYILGIVLLLCLTVWFAVLTLPKRELRLIACDVGQGDAILVTFATQQLLIDGGPDRRVLECLDRNLPFWDRQIEVVLMTHPQKDHFGGLIDVFENYDVKVFVSTPLDSSSQEFQVLKSVVGGRDIRVVNPKSGESISDGMIHLDIVWPSESFISLNTEVSKNADMSKNSDVLGIYTTSHDLNDFSIVAILRYGDFDALLTGDITQEVEDEILTTGLIKDVEYIKVPHHGSRNGLTEGLVMSTRPEIAVISSGKGNSYGHPHEEIINLLKDNNIRIFRTDEVGDVNVGTDGQRFWTDDN